MKRLSGFSLMEMMVVLLIVAVVAAASAPMVNKRMLNAAAERSPWVWTGLNNSIAYNLNANNAQTAIIGRFDVPDGNDVSTRLYIDYNNDQFPIIFGNQGGNLLGLGLHDNNISLTNGRLDTSESVVFGRNIDTSSNSIAIGNDITMDTGSSVAVGNFAQTNGIGAIAIGSANSQNARTIAGTQRSIAIGVEAEATDATSGTFDPIAIGTLAKSYSGHGIAIGNRAGTNGGGVQEVALGWGSFADGTKALAIGAGSAARGIRSIAIGGVENLNQGENFMADGNFSTAVGGMSNATTSATALGAGARATVAGSIAIGTGASAGTEFGADAGAAAGIFSSESVNNLLGRTNTSNLIAVDREIYEAEDPAARDDGRDGAEHFLWHGGGGGGDIVNYYCQKCGVAIQKNDLPYCSTCDRDGDGVLNENDGAPDDPNSTEWPDADGDGIPDHLDDFPNGGEVENAYNNVSTDAAIAVGSGSEALRGGLALGRDASATNSNSIAIGNQAGTEGSNTNSIAIGTGADATGESSVAIGNDASATEDGQIVIASPARRGQRNTIILGNTDTDVFIPGNVIIGNADQRTPSYLSVFGDIASNNSVIGRTVVGQRYYEDSNGNGDATKGNLKIDVIEYLFAAEKKYTEWDVWSHFSDRRLKDVGEVFTGGLEEIKKLEVFNYTFKKDPDKTPRVGVMAQDLQKIFPKAVFEGKDGFLRIRMEDMFYALVNAVKQLDAKIEELKNNQIAQLLDKVANLEKQNKEQAEVNAKQAKINAEQAELIEKLVKQNEAIAKQNKELEKRIKKLEK